MDSAENRLGGSVDCRRGRRFVNFRQLCHEGRAKRLGAALELAKRLGTRFAVRHHRGTLINYFA